MASVVASRLRTRPVAALVLLALAGMGWMVFSPDLTLLYEPPAIWARGRGIAVTLATVTVVCFGAMQIASEIEDKTALVWLTHPLSRPAFVTGKWLGTTLAGWGFLLVWAGGWSAMVLARQVEPVAAFVGHVMADALWIMVLAAVVTCFSTRVGYMAASVLGMAVVGGGLVAFALPVYAKALAIPGVDWALWGVYYLLPNRSHFAAEDAGSVRFWAELLVYAAGLTGFYLALAIASLERRDLN